MNGITVYFINSSCFLWKISMLDIQQIRRHPKEVQENFDRRGLDVSIEEFLALDKERLRLQTDIQEIRHKKNHLSKEVACRKKQGIETAEQVERIRQINDKLDVLEKRMQFMEEQTGEILTGLPNLLNDDVPDDSVVLRTFGTQKKFSFSPLGHMELCCNHGLVDYRTAGELMGSGYWIYGGMGARLEWGLLNFCLEENQKAGYEMLMFPPVARESCGFGAGQFPKFEDEVYRIQNEGQFLIPTAETVLVNLYRNKILENNRLPLKYTAYTPCFRREVSKNPKEKGMIRGHHFNKVEMVQFTTEEQSEEAFHDLLQQAEYLMQCLGLHYRVVRPGAEECGFSMAETYDLEVWLPAEGVYKEVSSISNARDYQARRTNTRYRDNYGRLHYAHTLNGSGLATSRLFAALLEQNQTESGQIRIPEVLVPWVGTDLFS